MERPLGRTSRETSASVESSETGTQVESATTSTDAAVRQAMHSWAGAVREALEANSSGVGVPEDPDGSGWRPNAAVSEKSPAAHSTTRTNPERRNRRSIIVSKPSEGIVFLTDRGRQDRLHTMRP